MKYDTTSNILLYGTIGLFGLIILRNLGKVAEIFKPITIEDKIRFMRLMKPIAEDIQGDFGIKTVITIGQGALESNWGMSGLTKQANNLFGIKATIAWIEAGNPVWTGKTTEYLDPENPDSATKLTANFKKYDTWEASARDWATLISRATRYLRLYQYSKAGDVSNYGKEVTRSGYATDPNYQYAFVNIASEVGKYV